MKYMLLTIFACFNLVNANILPSHQHALAEKHVTNDVLQFDDGSMWQIHPRSQYSITNWNYGDVLEFSQSTDNQNTRYRFWITNKTLGKHALAEVSQGPIKNNLRKETIIAFHQDKILLKNNTFFETTWVVSPNDLHRASRWELGDIVMVGVNNCWFKWSWYNTYDKILFNCATNEFIKARLY